jgi:hypothetical protein
MLARITGQTRGRPSHPHPVSQNHHQRSDQTDQVQDQPILEQLHIISISPFRSARIGQAADAHIGQVGNPNLEFHPNSGYKEKAV